MKILYVTTVGITMGFFKDFIKELVDEGHQVDIATNETEYKVPDFYRDLNCKIYAIDCTRSPFHKGNLKAIKQIKQLVINNQYDIVHCHTPIAAMCTRIACHKLRKKGTKVFYTAHGFHFYKGAPLKNWLLYYPVEKICAHFTDVLITINQEDYALAKRKMKAKRVEYVPGVGIDLEKFSNIIVDKVAKRKELGIPEDALMLFSVGELNENKNHETVIRAIADMDVYYMIAGKGDLYEYLQSMIEELGMTERVKLLGFRNDIKELCEISDIFIFSSFREGLSLSLMEAMACGKPIVCSRIRGNTDLIDKNGGALFDPHSVEECQEAIQIVIMSNREKMVVYNQEKVKLFSDEKVLQNIKNIYYNYKG